MDVFRDQVLGSMLLLIRTLAVFKIKHCAKELILFQRIMFRSFPFKRKMCATAFGKQLKKASNLTKF